MFLRTSHGGNRIVRSSKRRLARAIHIEGLEQRRLLTILNPQLVNFGGQPTEGIAFGTSTPLVATFASPAPDIVNLTATLAFPSGTTTTTITSSGASESIGGVNVPEFNVNYTGNWTPPDESPAVPFELSITDSTANTGNTTILPGTTAVKDAPLTETGGLITANIPEGKTIDPSPLMEFGDGNPNSTPSDFTATVDWGDGSPQAFGAISQPGGIGTDYFVDGSHAYAEEGSYTVTVQVADDGGSSLMRTQPHAP